MHLTPAFFFRPICAELIRIALEGLIHTKMLKMPLHYKGYLIETGI